MHEDASVTDSHSLRQRLLAPDPMQRAIALHALETEVERCACEHRGTLIQEIGRFAARGIPYYALHDPHFQAWVGKAVSYWEKLHSAPSLVPALAASAAPSRAPRRAGP